MGIFMDYCHRDLEKFETKKKISKILEIGAGNAPHYKYIKSKYDEYHIIETSDFAIKNYDKIQNITVKKYDGKKIPYENNSFDRIIISHCLEHIPDPETFIFEMMSKLNIDGILSISLPTDPGLLFRTGRQFLKFFSIKKTYKLSKEEFDYMNATEHINSIFGLRSIIKYHFKNDIQEKYLPFRIKFADLNLFYNVHICKKNS